MFKRHLVSSSGADAGLGRSLFCSSWLACLLFLAVIPHNWQQGANCEPSQQESRSQQPNELSQDLFGLSNSEGMAALNSYGRPGGAYVNKKRARKMSAFVPMRGRKDGRELLGADSLRLGQVGRNHYLQQQQEQQEQQQEQQRHAFMVPLSVLQPLLQQKQRQLDGQLEATTDYGEPLSGGASGRPPLESEPMNDDPSLAHLIGLAGGYDTTTNRLLSGNTKVPRQFVNQLEQIDRQFRAGESTNNSDNSSNNRLVATSSSSSSPSIGQHQLTSGADLMDAKFRRGFQPMRGKRFDDSGLVAAKLASASVGVDLWPALGLQDYFE